MNTLHQRSRGQRGRVATPLLVVLLIGLLATIGFSLWQYQRLTQLQETLQGTQARLGQLQRTHEQLQTEYTSLEQERANLEERLSSLRRELASKSTQLEELTRQWQQAQTQVSTLESTQADLTQRLQVTQTSLTETQQNATALQEKNQQLLRAARALKARITLIERDYTTLKEQADQPPHPEQPPTAVAQLAPHNTSIVQPPPSAPATVELPPIVVSPGHLPAKVLEVNTTHQFVILNQGTQAGLAPGMRLALRRGETPVGLLMVSRVRPTLCACDVLPPTDPTHVAVGDEAVVIDESR